MTGLALAIFFGFPDVFYVEGGGGEWCNARASQLAVLDRINKVKDHLFPQQRLINLMMIK